jgi:hypothetical protein
MGIVLIFFICNIEEANAPAPWAISEGNIPCKYDPNPFKGDCISIVSASTVVTGTSIALPALFKEESANNVLFGVGFVGEYASPGLIPLSTNKL